jgi:hypothetical protein
LRHETIDDAVEYDIIVSTSRSQLGNLCDMLRRQIGAQFDCETTAQACIHFQAFRSKCGGRQCSKAKTGQNQFFHGNLQLAQQQVA